MKIFFIAFSAFFLLISCGNQDFSSSPLFNEMKNTSKKWENSLSGSLQEAKKTYDSGKKAYDDVRQAIDSTNAAWDNVKKNTEKTTESFSGLIKDTEDALNTGINSVKHYTEFAEKK